MLKEAKDLEMQQTEKIVQDITSQRDTLQRKLNKAHALEKRSSDRLLAAEKETARLVTANTATISEVKLDRTGLRSRCSDQTKKISKLEKELRDLEGTNQSLCDDNRDANEKRGDAEFRLTELKSKYKKKKDTITKLKNYGKKKREEYEQLKEQLAAQKEMHVVHQKNEGENKKLKEQLVAQQEIVHQKNERIFHILCQHDPDIIPGDLCGPISHVLFQDPVQAADGNTYERSEIEAWFEACGTNYGEVESPMRKPMAHRNLVPDHAMRAKIQKYKEQMCGKDT